MVGHCNEEQVLGREELSLSHPDLVVLELNRLQNLLKERERELGSAQGEIKALRATEALKDKGMEELRNEVGKLDQKLGVTENLVQHRNLEIKKLTNEKKDALAAQYAAEAILRRVHANQKDDDPPPPPIESAIAPLEAEIKMYKNEIASLQEDKKAMERLTKSKEAALLEAERILRSALERALIVEEVQNQNYELKRQIEICQEENRILEKSNRQKVNEISELKEEKRMLERELARARVSANRVSLVVANEWKDENDKVMPVKQWLEERRLLQAEMQRLKEKLAISERTASAEAQMKEKLKLRLKTLEGLKHIPCFSANPNASCGSPKPGNTNKILGFIKINAGMRRRSTSQPRGSHININSPLQQPNIETENAIAAGKLNGADSFKKKYGSGENMLEKGMWGSRNKVIDISGKEIEEVKTNADSCINIHGIDDTTNSAETMNKGFLYDRLQKAVINLQKSCETKESSLNAKDQEIQMLMKKVNALTKSIEVESKKVKREAAAREKEAASAKLNKPKRFGV
ncbi:MICROTUBULE-ASSOCIATED PROTEIN 70-2 [Salix koriyanagi]|uniref:MICROTUBULE-ASSOCIATED PROTEIN 70-2 n=1 Tax=Salix koriyanagi TaxID=2511006 RepID=A0A9Q0X5X4_9ROSI|nr:MICROTUBULE-ASSOCIATED PROTEIN 70-2 [Salix koriyanagi]